MRWCCDKRFIKNFVGSQEVAFVTPKMQFSHCYLINKKFFLLCRLILPHFGFWKRLVFVSYAAVFSIEPIFVSYSEFIGK